MKSKILYLDCDGVILNTIQTAYQMMKANNLDIHDKSMVNHFFINIDWNILIYEAGILKRSTSFIRNIVENSEYEKIVILTKTSGNIYEENIKRKLFSKLFPDIPVITVDFNDNKDEIVDPKGHILVDDSHSNIERWNKAGGIGILFVKENPDFLKNEIDNLGDIKKTAIIKKLIKTRNI